MLFGKKKEVRKATINRKTNEVDIKGELVIDGRGKSKVVTGFEPLNHLLTLFSFHGLFDLNLKATGDLQHHIIEDIGIALGKAFKVALGDKTGINRYGSFSATMDKVVVEASIDISGRPVLYKQISAKDEMVIQDIWDHSRFDDTSFTSKDAEEFLD